MAEVKAKKYLGQHFLKDKNVARRIVESLPIQEKTSVLEIGPGMGILTQFLINQPLIDLVAIEIDHESVIYLHKHFPNLKVIEGDFLQLDLQKIFSGEFYIIGNFPYNISSQIFLNFLKIRILFHP